MKRITEVCSEVLEAFVIENAKLLLPEGRISRGSLAWKGERIVAIGSGEEVSRRIGQKARRIALEGALVLPGIWDCHTHMVYGAVEESRVKLRHVKSKEEFRAAIRRWIETHPREKWIVGGGWDESSWGGEPPTKEWLDDITGSRPLFLVRYDMHSAVANSVALRMAGIERHTPDPPGGKIVRASQGGEPTGWLLERAMELVERLIPEVDEAKKARLLRRALEEACRLGLVGLNDILLNFDDIKIYEAVYREGGNLPRVFITVPLGDLSRFIGQKGSELPEGLKLYGLKAFLDGSLGSRSAWMREPYLNRGDYRGVSCISDVHRFRELVLRATELSIPVSLHAIGDEAIGQALDVYWQCIREGLGNGPLRIEHFQHPSPRDIEAMDHPRLVASMQPVHLRFDAQVAEEALGPERARWSFPIASLMAKRCNVVFGSDWPVAPLSPLLGIHAAVRRADQAMRWPRGWIPEERIGILEALESYTWNPTRVLGIRDGGRLKEGLLADLTVVEDVTACEPEAIGQCKVLMTVVGGRVVHQDL